MPSPDGYTARHVWLVALPITAFVVGEVFIGLLGQRPLMQPGPQADAAITEAAARAQLLGAMLLFLSVGLGVIGKVMADVRTVDRPSERLRLCLTFALLVVAGLILILMARGEPLPRSRDLIGRSLLEEALKKSLTFGSPTHWGESAFEGLLTVTNIVAALAIAGLVTAGFSCLAQVAKDPVENWRRQSTRLRDVLYLSAVVMVVGVLSARYLTQYPAFMVPKDQQPLFTTLVNGLVAYTGIQYSIVLASFAVPVAVILEWRADELARESLQTSSLPSGDEQIAAKRKELGMALGSAEVVKTALAVLSPFLTGAAMTLTSLPS